MDYSNRELEEMITALQAKVSKLGSKLNDVIFDDIYDLHKRLTALEKKAPEQAEESSVEVRP